MKKFLLSILSVAMAVCANAAEATYTITAQDIVAGKSGSVELTTNGYGSQDMATESTWYTFTHASYSFTSCRICVASASNGGGIQLQYKNDNKGFIANTTAFNKIKKIELVARVASGNKNEPAFNIYVGTEPLPSETKLTAEKASKEDGDFKVFTYTYAVADAPSYFAVRDDQAGALYVDEIKVTYESDVVVINTPKFETKGGNYIGAQSVVLSADEGAKIFYTVDGTDPKTSETAKEYSEAIAVAETTTINAAAKVGDAWSETVNATYTILTPIATMADVFKAATDKDTEVAINFNGWVCTGAKGSNTYFSDGNGNGIVSYGSNAGFKAGDKLSGTAIVTLVLYNGYAEIKNFTNKAEGIEVAEGGEVAPVVVEIDDIAFVNQGAVVTIKGLSYNAKNKILTDGMADITPYNTFMTLPDFVESESVTYDITGVIIFYVKDNKTTIEIAPRTEADIVTNATLADPESEWSAASEDLVEGETAKATFTTKYTGTVTYTSSDENVATVSAEGVITAVAKGETTITAATAEGEGFVSSSKTLTINVVKAGESIFSKSDFEGQGTSGSGSEVKAEKNGVSVVVATGYWKKGDNHLKVYGSKYNDDKTEITTPSTVTISAPAGKHLTQVVMKATSKDYIKTWKVGETDLTIDEEAFTATWTGEANDITLVLTSNSQARLVSFDILVADGKVDAIESVVADRANGAIFNLAGQKVGADFKGLVIKNGKKVLVK
ncbi:MAG: chitobiase/beta-hexosaminidase C-terminal domain-containing protein [Bacteroidaceae bacterium]|nr:chitobiase/beta-hexosaminidase C-terminal domain-containing protein [Bacteroidaceae bacterium]